MCKFKHINNYITVNDKKNFVNCVAKNLPSIADTENGFGIFKRCKYKFE